jgi:hypothetical protein
MKLLFCTECGDVIKLGYLPTTCACGLSSGNYFSDGLNAQVKGKNALLLGFANSTLTSALKAHKKNPGGKDGMGWRFEAFIIPEPCGSVIRDD